MRLDFSLDKPMPWPTKFERILQSRGTNLHSAKTRAQKRATGPEGDCGDEPIAFQFEGRGKDSSEYVFRPPLTPS